MDATTTCSKDKPIKATKKLQVPMYSCSVHFIITDDVKGYLQGLYKKYKIPVLEDGGDAEGFVFSPDLVSYIVCVGTKYLTTNTLAHELFHATIRITEDRGINDEEQQAWLIGWLTENMYKFLNKKGLSVK